MKKVIKSWIYSITIMGLLLIIISGCNKKDDNNNTPASQVPRLTSDVVSNIAQTTATSGGNVTSQGTSAVITRGVCWSFSENPSTSDAHTTDGSGTGSFTSSLSGLTPNTPYYVRAYAMNSSGTAYGNQVSFITTVGVTVPTITTNVVSNIEQTTATSGGSITSQGTSAVSARGLCWSISANPSTFDAHTTDGSGTGTFTSILTGLTPNTTYYIRAYATNSSGTAYGNLLNFKTQSGTGGTVADIDGNIYHTVTIGTQTWMVENLKTTKYNDGSAIPMVTDGISWSNLTTPGFCWYNNDSATNKNTYGALYNWFTLNTGKLAPTGWHVPTDEEWTILTDYLGGETVAGGKMKSTGTIEAGTGLWNYPNTNATNKSGFTAVPAGYRQDGTFYIIGINGFWWSSTAYDTSDGWHRALTNINARVYRDNYNKSYGLSVRCLRDF